MLRINAHSASNILGEQLFNYYLYAKDDLLKSTNELYADRFGDTDIERLDSGSIFFGSSLTLTLFAWAAGAKHVAEVGTYIGVSSASIALGGLSAGTLSSLDTCDINPATPEPLRGLKGSESVSTTVHQANSKSMFDILLKRRVKIDFLHVDGRIDDNDIKVLKKILSPHAYIALDDCESDEKGHVNLDKMRVSGLLDKHFYIKPFSPNIFKTWGIYTRSTTGLLIPKNRILLVRQ